MLNTAPMARNSRRAGVAQVANNLLHEPDRLLELVDLVGSVKRMTTVPSDANSLFGSALPDERAVTATVRFHGPLRVTMSNGADITPGSQLRQAILAVLVAAPGQIRSRRSLQDMFWGSVDPARASASLRTALYLLRRDLASLGWDVLSADRQTVALRPGCLVGQAANRPDPCFLEGMDLPLDDCEGFEDWLRSMRQPAEPPEEPALRGGASARQDRSWRIQTAPASRLALGLLPAIHPGIAVWDLCKAEGVLDEIARFFSQITLLDVHDLRNLDQRVAPLPLESGLGPTHWLQALIEPWEDTFRMRLRLVEATTRRLLWLSDPLAFWGTGDSHLAWRLGETITERMRDSPAIADAPNLFPFTAIAALFSLDHDLIRQTETHLLRMIEAGGPPVLQCLFLFTQVFKVNESIGPMADLNIDNLCEMLATIPSSDPLLPLCQSLAGYSVHMLHAENDLAIHLVENAYRLAPSLPLNLDHLAVLRLMRGDMDGAERAFRQCIAAGAFSPWRYTYDVTGSMIYMMQGDLSQSLYFSNQAMFRKPRYLAALRYAMAGLALSDKPQDAQRMLGRLNKLRPGYDLSSWVDGFLRRVPSDLGDRLVCGLKESELL